jgi:hypothetical protein
MNEKPDAVGNDQVDPNDPYHTHVRIEQKKQHREHRGEHGVPDQRVDDAAAGKTLDAPEEGKCFQRMAGNSAALRIARCAGSVDGRHGIAFSTFPGADAPRGRSGVPSVRAMLEARKAGCDERAGGGAETAPIGAGSSSGRHAHRRSPRACQSAAGRALEPDGGLQGRPLHRRRACGQTAEELFECSERRRRPTVE